MRILFTPQIFSILITSILCMTFLAPVLSQRQCLEDQKILLLKLKDEFLFNSSASRKLVRWNENEDCCSWDGIGCDTSGHVIGLELDNESINAGLENSTSLFSLQYLEKLNLAFNNFRNIQIPRRIYNLTNLTHLNLSEAGFAGQIPGELSTMKKLVSLDLSNLSNCSLEGSFPNKIFQLPTLQNLDLSNNILLGGTLPQFPRAVSLRNMVLSGTNFSGSLPDSISNLNMLSRIDLSSCKFSGQIPSAITNLTEVVYLDLSNNNFTGLIPKFHKSKNLTHINLSHNQLTGPLSSAHFQGLSNLDYINLGNNLLTGNLPSALFELPSLRWLLLFNNQLDGQIEELSNPGASQLSYLDLSSNNLRGTIPKFFFKFEQLNSLVLSFNHFNGTFQLEMIKESRRLRFLEVSYNNLSIDLSNSKSKLSFFPNIETLKLASCNLQEFPERLRRLNLSTLDLSSNQLKGEIPTWIWEINNGFLSYLNLSVNQLAGFQNPHKIPSILMEVLDLSSNRLRGELPIPPLNSLYVDFSDNNFSSTIPADIGNYISVAYFFSVSNSSLSGVIPKSMCNTYFLEILDLSNNALNGTIPSCLTENNGIHLKILNLQSNMLSGTIPDSFPMNCSLNTLDLSQNLLAGKIPESVVNCPLLEVLNIGNNKIQDSFPCMLVHCTSLRVLVLRSNRFYGDLHCPGGRNEWPNLQIMDISVNHFTGDLSPSYFSNWKGMMNSNFGHDAIRFDSMVNGFHYQVTVKMTIKKQERELEKILRIFTSIDFSRNKLKGKIPDSIGDLKSLYLLNLSSNEFTETIPSSIGNLTQLGSLDLSMNHLEGKIPEEVANLTFLAVLNLSFNNLSGNIPPGNQLQTFSADSYQGNVGLCGFPLNISCDSNKVDHVRISKFEIHWVYVFAVLGFVTALGTSVWVLVR